MSAATLDREHPTATRLDALARRGRWMWRHEPMASGDARTELLLQLRSVRSRVEQLEARHRAGTLDEGAADGEIRRLARRLDVLGVHWPA